MLWMIDRLYFKIFLNLIKKNVKNDGGKEREREKEEEVRVLYERNGIKRIINHLMWEFENS